MSLSNVAAITSKAIGEIEARFSSYPQAKEDAVNFLIAAEGETAGCLNLLQRERITLTEFNRSLSANIVIPQTTDSWHVRFQTNLGGITQISKLDAKTGTVRFNLVFNEATSIRMIQRNDPNREGVLFNSDGTINGYFRFSADGVVREVREGIYGKIVAIGYSKSE
jgi:hypothetical protein